MKAPQIIMAVLFVMNLTIHLVKHGEPQNKEYNFFTELFSVGLSCALLWWGGFFG